jgi:hypothetical protein
MKTDDKGGFSLPVSIKYLCSDIKGGVNWVSVSIKGREISRAFGDLLAAEEKDEKKEVIINAEGLKSTFVIQ